MGMCNDHSRRISPVRVGVFGVGRGGRYGRRETVFSGYGPRLDLGGLSPRRCALYGSRPATTCGDATAVISRQRVVSLAEIALVVVALAGFGVALWRVVIEQLSIVLAGRIWRPWDVLQNLPRHARQLGDVHRDQEHLVAYRSKTIRRWGGRRGLAAGMASWVTSPQTT